MYLHIWSKRFENMSENNLIHPSFKSIMPWAQNSWKDLVHLRTEAIQLK